MLIFYIFGAVLFTLLQNSFCRTISAATNGHFEMTKSTCSCPDSSWYYLNETKSCYKIVKFDNMTCDDARQLCSNLNSTLASIHSAKENIFIAGTCDDARFRYMFFLNNKFSGIALSDEYGANAYTAIGLIGEKNTWKWLDGTAFNFNGMYYWDDQDGTPKDGFCADMRTQAKDRYLSTWFKHEINLRGFRQAVCKMNANL